MKTFRYIALLSLITLPFLGNGQSNINVLASENAASVPIPFEAHSSIRPSIEILKQDTLTIFRPKCAFSPPHFIKYRPNLWLDAVNQFKGTGQEQNYGAGMWLNAKFSDNWSANFGIRYVYQSANDSLQTPSINSQSMLRFNTSGLDIRGRIRYQFHPNIQFIAGVDKNFIGEGNRSVLLSDYGNPYSFVQMQFKIWKFKYLFMTQFLKESNAAQESSYSNKYAATHYLDYNVCKGFSIGFFESVLFQPKDTLLNRGFDLEYINPMVFFRPQEYNNGSADNVLVGFNTHYTYKNVKVYGQLALDEFLLNELKARNGFWGNKYSAQLGVKGTHRLQQLKLFWRTEFNYIQRFTYSHLSNLQNYGNLNSPLAHPLQSGFQEILAEFSLAYGKKDRFRCAIFGAITSLKKNVDLTTNVGEHIYSPYNTRAGDYGYFVPHFSKNTLNPFGNIKLSYTTSNNFYEVFVQGGINNLQQNFIAFGLRSQIGNLYLNY